MRCAVSGAWRRAEALNLTLRGSLRVAVQNADARRIRKISESPIELLGLRKEIRRCCGSGVLDETRQ